jgi:hypothetical protein
MGSQPAREVLNTGRGGRRIITIENGKTETREQMTAMPRLCFFYCRNALTSELAIGCKMSLRQVLIEIPTGNAKNFVANGCGVQNSGGRLPYIVNIS